MIIYLIGYMCSGKTTLGTIMKNHLGVTFTDLDEHIEKEEGESINSIFAKRGEEEFRKLEQKALHEVSESIGGVIATGGGTPCFYDNMEYMNKSGYTIYLKCSEQELLNRLKIYKATRPLLKDKNDEELQRYIQNSLPQREPYYNQASLILDANPLSDEEGAIELAKDLIKKLSL